MTILDELIEGASGSDADVAGLLRKVKVVAARIGSADALEAWVDYELVGYAADATLPEYRGPFSAEVLGTFGGYFGSGIKNAPIPAMAFPKDMREWGIFKLEFREPIAEVEQLSKSTSVLRSSWGGDMIAFTNGLIQRGEVQLYEGMGLQEAWRNISPHFLKGIVDTVRTRILDLALSLEKIAPNAGQKGGSAPSAEQVHQIVTNVYGGTHNIAVGSRDFSQTVQPPSPGDAAALLQALESVGVDADDLLELRSVLNEADDDEGARHGVRDWLGGFLAKSAMGVGLVGTGAAADVVGRIVAGYLGIG